MPLTTRPGGQLPNCPMGIVFKGPAFVATPFLSCSLPPINSMKVGGNRAQTCSGADEFRHLFDKRTV